MISANEVVLVASWGATHYLLDFRFPLFNLSSELASLSSLKQSERRIEGCA